MMSKAFPSLLPLIQWYRDQNRQLPWRRHWLETKDPYGVWVSEVMLQQTVIKVVVPVYLRFMQRFPTVCHLAKASEEELREAVRGLGYYRRFRMMHDCAKKLVTTPIADQANDGSVGYFRYFWPTSAAELQKLPGIGTYTSAAISSIAFGERVAVVDGNVERVLCRLEGLSVQPKDPKIKKRLSKIAQDYLDNGYGEHSTLHVDQLATLPGDHNQAMMELGQLICTPLQPECSRCPLVNQCEGYHLGIQNQIPLPTVRKASVSIFFSLSIVLKTERNQVLIGLFRRGSKARFLKESWGFLTDWSEHALPRQDSIGSFRHSITHHRLSVEVFTRRAGTIDHDPIQGRHRDSLTQEQQWVSMDLVEPLLVANLDRKAWKIFQKSINADKIRGGLSRHLTVGQRGAKQLLLS